MPDFDWYARTITSLVGVIEKLVSKAPGSPGRYPPVAVVQMTIGAPVKQRRKDEPRFEG